MTISVRGVNNAAGQNNGTTTTAGTASITPTGTPTVGDRVFLIEDASNTSAALPSGWEVLGTKDAVVGSGTVAASSGARRMTVYWRDYDGIWTMPAFALTSATQNSHWIGVIILTPTAGAAFNEPTISSIGTDFGTPNTAHSATTGSMTTHAGSMLVIGTCLNDNVTSSGGTLTQTGATFGTVTEQCDGGTATGNDVSGKVHTVPVTTGATAALTFATTLSAASEGGSVIIEQTESTPAAVSTLVEPFNNLNAWAQLGGRGGTVTASGGKAVCPVTNTVGDGSGIRSLLPFNLAGSSVIFKVTGISSAGTDSQSIKVGTAGWGFTFSSGLVFDDAGSGNIATFDPSTDPYLRLSEAGGTVSYDWSADGVSWTNFSTQSVGTFPLTGTVVIQALNQTAATGQTFEVDEINPAIISANTGAFFAMF